MKALIIIDMQVGSFIDIERYDAVGVIERINALADLYRKESNKVIFVQHDGTKENCFLPGTPEWEILEELVIEPEDNFIVKTANDSFYQTDLDTLLKTYEINDITITGSATDFCIESTVQSAIVKDYNITIIKDGHTAADRPYLTAKSVIDHYNWVWENLSPTNGSVKAITFEDYIK